MSNETDRLFAILSSPAFLAMEGLTNEVPIFIHAYEVAQEDGVCAMIKALASRLRNAGVETAEADLFQLFLEELEAEDVLEGFIEGESEYDRNELLSALQSRADPKDRLVPRLVDLMEQEQARLTLLSGIGHIYPFLRAHSLLEAIQPAMMRHPVVMFFPGEYIQVPGKGSQLRLFGRIQPKDYYRAFNLAHYRIKSV